VFFYREATEVAYLPFAAEIVFVSYCIKKKPKGKPKDRPRRKLAVNSF
jgi:hypothetical protein